MIPPCKSLVILGWQLRKLTNEMGNVLDPHDQVMFDLGRATGATSLLQCAWVYNRPLDIDRLRRFHEELQRGSLSRRIERSPLPFGRHRWVSPDDSCAFEIATSARPREQFDAWLQEQANTPLDPEHEPGWHLAAFPFTDGGAGLSLVISHCLSDGVGLCEALADAARGHHHPRRWPAARSRRRWQALREDARQTARDIPAFGRAGVAAVRLARRRWRAGSPSGLPATPPAPLDGADEPISLPVVTIFVDADEWGARAHSLGGTSNSLLAGVAARLAQRLGRITADGSVALRMPVNERVAHDPRANANSNVDIAVDPAFGSGDLRGIRAAIKQALTRHLEVPDEERAMLSLVPLLPKRLIRVAPDATSVVSSNLGVIDPAAGQPDGADADYFAMRILYPGVTTSILHRIGGLQMLVSGQAHGHVFVSAIAYQPDGPNSNDLLRQNLLSALNDFSLTGAHL